MKYDHTNNATATRVSEASIEGDNAFLVDAYGFGAIGYCDCPFYLNQGSVVEEEDATVLLGAPTAGKLKRQ